MAIVILPTELRQQRSTSESFSDRNRMWASSTATMLESISRSGFTIARRSLFWKSVTAHLYAPADSSHFRWEILRICEGLETAPTTYEDEREDGVIVVHGHTPHVDVELCANRINIDTGAYETGRLTAAQLLGSELRFIQAVG